MRALFSAKIVHDTDKSALTQHNAPYAKHKMHNSLKTAFTRFRNQGQVLKGISRRLAFFMIPTRVPGKIRRDQCLAPQKYSASTYVFVTVLASTEAYNKM